jgi:hypothetical protein
VIEIVDVHEADIESWRATRRVNGQKTVIVTGMHVLARKIT